MNRLGHWASLDESGTVIGMSLLILAYRLGGRWLFYIFLFPVICFYFICHRQARAASMDFLMRVHQFDESLPKPSGWRVFQHFWRFGLVLIDKLRVWMGHITLQDVNIYGGDVFDQLFNNGHGAVIMISHLGNFEICQALSQRHKGFKLTVLHHTKHAQKFNRLLRKYAGDANIELLQVTEITMATAIMLADRISRGEFVAIAADRIPVSNQGAVMMTEFLGAKAAFPKGPFVLAQALGAPILFIICIKQQGVYHIDLEMLSSGQLVARSDRDQAALSLLQNYAARLQYYCLKEPTQWFNFYRFWQEPSAKKEPA